MRVLVRTGGPLREVLGARQALELPPEATVHDLLEQLAGAPALPAGALERVAVSVAGTIVERSRVLADGDEVALVTPVAGG